MNNILLFVAGNSNKINTIKSCADSAKEKHIKSKPPPLNWLYLYLSNGKHKQTDERKKLSENGNKLGRSPHRDGHQRRRNRSPRPQSSCSCSRRLQPISRLRLRP